MRGGCLAQCRARRETTPPVVTGRSRWCACIIKRAVLELEPGGLPAEYLCTQIPLCLKVNHLLLCAFFAVLVSPAKKRDVLRAIVLVDLAASLDGGEGGGKKQLLKIYASR